MDCRRRRSSVVLSAEGMRLPNAAFVSLEGQYDPISKSNALVGAVSSPTGLMYDQVGVFASDWERVPRNAVGLSKDARQWLNRFSIDLGHVNPGPHDLGDNLEAVNPVPHDL